MQVVFRIVVETLVVEYRLHLQQALLQGLLMTARGFFEYDEDRYVSVLVESSKREQWELLAFPWHTEQARAALGRTMSCETM